MGLNVFNQLFVGGYNEYTPELLPLGSRFRDGFQGKTATALLQPNTAVWSESTGSLEFLPGSPSFCKQRGKCVMKREFTALDCVCGQKRALKLIVSAPINHSLYSLMLCANLFHC